MQLEPRIPNGRDDRTHAVMGNFHYHRCEWCHGEVACFNGPACDLERTEGHCCQACFNHDPDRRGVADGNVVVGPLD